MLKNVRLYLTPEDAALQSEVKLLGVIWCTVFLVLIRSSSLTHSFTCAIRLRSPKLSPLTKPQGLRWNLNCKSVSLLSNDKELKNTTELLKVAIHICQTRFLYHQLQITVDNQIFTQFQRIQYVFPVLLNRSVPREGKVYGHQPSLPIILPQSGTSEHHEHTTASSGWFLTLC